jgi:D-amino peptidase
MNRFARIAVAAGIIALALTADGVAAQQRNNPAPQRPLKVFISVDMEGLAGVVTNSEVTTTGADYAHFRGIMAAETNAAIEGAFRAGAMEVLVRDGHGSKQNLLPGDLDPRARLLRGASAGAKNMMEGIDSTFGAVVFIGYHAKAGTEHAILEHTSNGNVVDVSINGVSLPEGGYNALMAGLYGVPVVFVAGDQALVAQIRELLGPVAGVAVKEEIADAINTMSPKRAQGEIRAGVEQGVRNRASVKPYRLSAPYTMVLKVKLEKPPYPGAERVQAGEFRFSSNDLLEVMKAFNAMK